MESEMEKQQEQQEQQEIPKVEQNSQVSILEELLSRSNVAPMYEYVQITVGHQPIFMCRASYTENNRDIYGIGKGRNEMDSQEAAARALLDKLNGSAQDDEDPSNNPVGRLRALCVERRWPVPYYETVLELTGEFATVCRISRFRVVADGSNTQISKHMAAHKMFALVEDDPTFLQRINKEMDGRSV